MRRIIIIGYMGAGKTTVGRALAKETGMQFYDLDWYIEARMHKTVPQLFAERGEDGFRQVEHNLLHEAAEFEDVIISSGGGTPCFFDNMEYMNAQGDTVYLKAEPDVLCAHLKMGKVKRPLLEGKSQEELLHRRPAGAARTILHEGEIRARREPARQLREDTDIGGEAQGDAFIIIKS